MFYLCSSFCTRKRRKKEADGWSLNVSVHIPYGATLWSARWNGIKQKQPQGSGLHFGGKKRFAKPGLAQPRPDSRSGSPAREASTASLKREVFRDGSVREGWRWWLLTDSRPRPHVLEYYWKRGLFLFSAFLASPLNQNGVSGHGKQSFWKTPTRVEVFVNSVFYVLVRTGGTEATRNHDIITSVHTLGVMQHCDTQRELSALRVWRWKGVIPTK